MEHPSQTGERYSKSARESREAQLARERAMTPQEREAAARELAARVAAFRARVIRQPGA
ncbi:MAG: hypothetical protein AB7N76_09550 [Planctomycetota bacterium]